MSVFEKFVIVIPVFNDDDVLEKLLEDLAEQTSPPPRTDAEVEAAYLRKQALLKDENDKTN